MKILQIAILVALVGVGALLYRNLASHDYVKVPEQAAASAGDRVLPVSENPTPVEAPPAPNPPTAQAPQAPVRAASFARPAFNARPSPFAPAPVSSRAVPAEAPALPAAAATSASSAQSAPLETASAQAPPPPPAVETAAPDPEPPERASARAKPFTPFKPEPPNPEAKAREPRTVTIPAGTLLSVRLGERLDSSVNQTGDVFRASLDSPLVIQDMVIAEKGARLQGRILEARDAGKVKGTAYLKLALTEVATSDGQNVKIETEEFEVEGEKSVKKDAVKIGAAAAIGAAIGAIAGGGKGAAIGAGAGGAAGTGGVLLTKGKPAALPAETRITFRITREITLTERL